jgi:hypothetical protein
VKLKISSDHDARSRVAHGTGRTTCSRLPLVTALRPLLGLEPQELKPDLTEVIELYHCYCSRNSLSGQATAKRELILLSIWPGLKDFSPARWVVQMGCGACGRWLAGAIDASSGGIGG